MVIGDWYVTNAKSVAFITHQSPITIFQFPKPTVLRQPPFPLQSPARRRKTMRHVISALVVNEPGVLANVAGMFAARGFNIDSLVVGRTEDPNLSPMTIVVDADENTLEQVRKQLAKLVPVTQVKDFKDSAYIERDLALITVGTR